MNYVGIKCVKCGKQVQTTHISINKLKSYKCKECRGNKWL